MSGVKTHFTQVIFSYSRVGRPAICGQTSCMTRAAVGVPEHGRMCVGVLTVLKIGNTWETTDKSSACVCLCLCWVRPCEWSSILPRSDMWCEDSIIKGSQGKNAYVFARAYRKGQRRIRGGGGSHGNTRKQSMLAHVEMQLKDMRDF